MSGRALSTVGLDYIHGSNIAGTFIMEIDLVIKLLPVSVKSDLETSKRSIGVEYHGALNVIYMTFYTMRKLFSSSPSLPSYGL